MKIVAVRVPEKIKKEMKEIPENWSEYLRKAIEERIKQQQQKKILQEVRELLKDVPKSPKGFSAKSIREDRDSG
jgi:chemotaxis regulatin CheY-phosphate phosphatase CheZ